MNELIKILGINYGGHDTSACLMVDGQFVACCEEERYNKIKHTREFPINAIEDCLKKGNITLDDVDEIAMTYNPDVFKSDNLVGKMRRTLPNKIEYREILKEKLGYVGKVSFHLHHLCHIASAYYPSGFNNALLISNDGIGEIDCSLIAGGDDGNINILHNGNRWPNSIGLFYTAITAYLGWKPHYDEGIVMGLAPYGDDNEIIPEYNRTYREVFEEMIFEVDDFDYEINPYWLAFHKVRDKWVSDNFVKVFGPRKKWEDEITQHHKNIACAVQRRLENMVMKQLKIAIEKYGYNKLCIAGGVGLNCSLNGKIEKSGIFDEIFVQPASGDNGTPIGACYLSYKNYNKNLKPKKTHNFYLGSSFTDDEIKRDLDNILDKTDDDWSYHKSDNVYEETAKIINDKKIVAWFQGGAEFGPRALGNRSILVSTYPASMKDYINEKVKFREEFRPFAPAVLYEHKNDYFDLSQESPHMLMACKTHKDKIKDIPSIVHVDDSARAQTVKEENNPKFRKLLEEFHKLTGCAVLLNTSFNVKGQPIVNSPEDAIKCFLSTKIDVLVIGNFIAYKSKG